MGEVRQIAGSNCRIQGFVAPLSRITLHFIRATLLDIESETTLNFYGISTLCQFRHYLGRPG
jgi:hypothetical protein